MCNDVFKYSGHFEFPWGAIRFDRNSMSTDNDQVVYLDSIQFEIAAKQRNWWLNKLSSIMEDIRDVMEAN